MTRLPDVFRRIPLAHRAYHDRAAGRSENSRAAARAAVAVGYGIEIDVQPAADGTPMVFHDYDLDRLTRATGPIRNRDVGELGVTPLREGTESVPTLAEILDLVAGAVPLLIEIKDQDGRATGDHGALERAVADTVVGYAGPLAVMAFSPRSVGVLAEALPEIPRGLTTCGFTADDWPLLDAARRARLRAIADFAEVGAAFVCHRLVDLDNPRLAELKAQDVPILAWTVRSPAQESEARRIADNITFEGYAPAISGA